MATTALALPRTPKLPPARSTLEKLRAEIVDILSLLDSAEDLRAVKLYAEARRARAESPPGTEEIVLQLLRHDGGWVPALELVTHITEAHSHLTERAVRSALKRLADKGDIEPHPDERGRYRLARP